MDLIEDPFADFKIKPNKELYEYICASLPFGLKFNVDGKIKTLSDIYSVNGLGFNNTGSFYGWNSFKMKPYLISITKNNIGGIIEKTNGFRESSACSFSNIESLLQMQGSLLSYFVSHHIDIYGLIEKDLALPAKNGLYP